MDRSPLKPRSSDLTSNLRLYFVENGSDEGSQHCLLLHELCHKIDKVLRKVTVLALTHTPNHLKSSFIVSLPPGCNKTPLATQIAEGTYKISIPIAFVDGLLGTAASDQVRPNGAESIVFVDSILIASVAAFAHEICHVFAGHLSYPNSRSQEFYCDNQAGALTYAWLHHDELVNELHSPDLPAALQCVFGFLHLASNLSETNPETSVYLPPNLRFSSFCGGAAFYADRMEFGGGNALSDARRFMPFCPLPHLKSPHIESKSVSLLRDDDDESVRVVAAIIQEVEADKKQWYNSSEHLRPIRPDLHKARE